MEERDRGAHRSVPRSLVDQPHLPAADLREGRDHVGDGVTDMVNSLTPARQEPADRGLVAERLEELNVAGGALGGRGAPQVERASSVVASIASRTPCSAFVSRLTTSSPKTDVYRSMAASSERQAIPT